MKDDTTENKKYISSVLDLFSIPNFYIRKGRPQVWESTWMQRVPYGKSTSKEMPQEEIWQHPRPIHPRQDLQEDDDWVGSLWRDHPWDGSACKRKPTIILPPKQKLTYTVATGGFARTWWISTRCQQGINLTSRKHCRLSSPQDSGGQGALWKLVTKFLLMVAMANELVGTRLWEFTTKMDWTLIERKPVYSMHQLFICGMTLSKNWTAVSSLPSPTGGVNRIPPETEIHEQTTVTNGYEKVSTTRSTLPTTVRPLLDNYVNDATHVDLHKMQHWAHCTRSVVESSEFIHHTTWLKPFALVFHSHHIHGHAQRSLSVFSPSLSTSCCSSSSSFSSWPTVTPWQLTTCATP